MSAKRVLNHDFSCVFVIYPKNATENELKIEFERYGPIENLYVLKENMTGLGKGMAYIKFTKASHAAKSMEELNGKLLSNINETPLKVLISKINSINQNKSNSMTSNASTIALSTNDNDNDNDRLFRLFVKIPKHFDKKDLELAFMKFGKIENVQIIFDRVGNEKNTGFGYVRFYKASDAAQALEECDLQFQAKYADPYSVKLLRERKKKHLIKNFLSTNSSIDHALSSAPLNQASLLLKFKFSGTLPGQNLFNLLSLIPGLLEIKVLKFSTVNQIHEAFYFIKYSTNMSASYAKKTLNQLAFQGFELFVIQA